MVSPPYFHHGTVCGNKKSRLLNAPLLAPNSGTDTMIMEWARGSTLPNRIVHSPIKCTILWLEISVLKAFEKQLIYCVIIFTIVRLTP